MKLVSLNLWGGKIHKPLMEFLIGQAKDTDIFCFQEMLNAPQSTEYQEGKNTLDLFLRCQQMFPEFEGFFESVEENWVEDLSNPWGLAIFARRTIPISEQGEFFVFRERNTMVRQNPSTIPRLVQYIKFAHNQKQFTICNFHGLYKEGTDKKDTPERYAQSRKIKTFLNQTNGAKILCGDFNLTPETEALSILEKGMINLIIKYGITSTRSPLYRHYKTGLRFADYVLVSPDVNVRDFKVSDVEISDHLPMILEFE